MFDRVMSQHQNIEYNSTVMNYAYQMYYMKYNLLYAYFAAMPFYLVFRRKVESDMNIDVKLNNNSNFKLAKKRGLASKYDSTVKLWGSTNMSK